MNNHLEKTPVMDGRTAKKQDHMTSSLTSCMTFLWPKQVTWPSPISWSLVEKSTKGVSTRRGEVWRTIVQSNTNTIVVFHKNKVTYQKNMGSVGCLCVIAAYLFLISKHNAFFIEIRS